MRILAISNYYPPLEIGGWEQLTRDVVQHLEARGHQVQVLTSNFRAGEIDDPEPGVARTLHLQSPDHVRYRPRYMLLGRKWESENRAQIEEMVARFRPNVIFINGMWNLPRTVAKRAEELLPGRVVYYVASYWPTDPAAQSTFWALPARRPWLGAAKKWLGYLLEKSLFPPLQAHLDFPLVLCVSRYVQRYMIETVGVRPEQVRVVYNGIDPANFPFVMRDVTRDRLRLLYAGRLSPDKGVHTVIESLGIVREKCPNLDVSLTIVGGGAPDYEASLRRQAAELGIQEVVCFVGKVAREAMPDILAQHDVLVFPSVWPEPLARMIQEAMASGLLVIGTTTGGTPEILRDGENGLTFSAGDARMLAEKIVTLARTPQARVRMVQAARRTVEETFTMQRMVDEVEFYLNSVTESGEHVVEQA